MFPKIPFRSCLLSLILELVQLSSGHPDCNHDWVSTNFFYMCSSYSEVSNSIKRETNIADASGILFEVPQDEQSHTDDESLIQPQPQPFDLTQQQSGVDVVPQDHAQQLQPQQQSPIYPAHVQYPWPESMSKGPSLAIPFQDLQNAPRRKGNLIRLPPTAPIPNEPEDFATFNSWYLNPVNADADWQHTIERWRRRSHISEEIWKFVRNKCCVSGCAFPADYWELDKRVNICKFY